MSNKTTPQTKEILSDKRFTTIQEQSIQIETLSNELLSSLIDKISELLGQQPREDAICKETINDNCVTDRVLDIQNKTLDNLNDCISVLGLL